MIIVDQFLCTSRCPLLRFCRANGMRNRRNHCCSPSKSHLQTLEDSDGLDMSQAQLRAEVVEAREQDLTACGAQSSLEQYCNRTGSVMVLLCCVNLCQSVSISTNLCHQHLKISQDINYPRILMKCFLPYEDLRGAAP